MTLSKLRPPNFTLSSKGDEGIITNINKDVDNNNLSSLSSYTSKCQQQLLLTVSESSSEVDIDQNDTNNDDVSYNNGQNTGNSKTSKESNNEPSMEQCILLLESHLSGFQRGCRQKDDKLQGKKKKRRKVDHDHTPPTQQQLLPNIDGDGTEEHDDDVPPQLLRLARFFHYRWLPIKRALLRPVANNDDMLLPLRDQQSTLHENTQSDQRPPSSVEVGLEYRLRLAKACWKQGLVAAAEYEMLTASLDKVLHPRNIDEDSTGGLTSNVQSNDCGDGDDLLERVRMALLRLPKDATIKSSISTSSTSHHSHATAIAAWRHAKEMILKCCQYWEENGVTITMLTPSVKVLEEDEAKTFNELVSRVGLPKVVDWALTSWTALLLSQGVVDGFATDSSSPISSSSTVSKIERDFASLLSNRSQSINNDSNPFQLFSVAVSNRINEILSNNSHLKQMSGIHLVSMARLLASFHSRANAEEHIMTSIITSAMMKGGGMDVLDPLSRLLAIYCCDISIKGGNIIPRDNLVGSTASRSTAGDLERRLRSKLNDVTFVDGALASCGKGETEQRGEVLPRTKSFMEVLFTMSVHFIKCRGRN